MKREIKQYQKHVVDSIKHFSKKTEQQIEKIANSNGEQIETTKARLQGLVIKLEKHLKEIEIFNKIVEENKLQVSRSPYSPSIYAFKKGENISWGEKPEGSYRLADHWNWQDEEGVIHCPTVDGQEYGHAFCVIKDGKYEKIG